MDCSEPHDGRRHERCVIAKVVNDQLRGQPTSTTHHSAQWRWPPTQDCIGSIATHQVRDDERNQYAPNAGADAIEQLDSDEPGTVVRKGIEKRPDRQNCKADEFALSAPLVSLLPGKKLRAAASPTGGNDARGHSSWL